MIWADKLRERTLGSPFGVDEIPGLLSVSNEEAKKIFGDLLKFCWVRIKSTKWVVLTAETRQEYIRECLHTTEMNIKNEYELFTHLKSLLDE